MKRLGRYKIALVAAQLLVACGGGGGQGGQTPPITSPAPTPTPTSTPSPAPAPTYTLASDFARDQSYETFGTILRVANNQQTGGSERLAVETYGPSNRLTVMFTADPARAVLRRGGATGAQVFDYSVLDQRSPRVVTVRSSDADLSGTISLAQFGPTAGNLPTWLDYIVAMNGTGALSRNGPVVEAATYTLFGGSRTLFDDLPSTGVVRYSGYLSMQGLAPDARNLFGYLASGVFGNPGFFEVTVDFASRTLQARIPAQADGSARTVNLDVTGTLPTGSRTWDGTITSDAGGSGTISGSFFGPRGRELGLAITYREGDKLYGGTLVGITNIGM